MKKRLILIFIIISFLFPIRVEALQVVGIGDSITTGFGVAKEQSYLQVFCKYLEEKEQETVTCKNQAIDGITSKQLLLHLKEENFQLEIKKADYLFMSIGGNDYLQELATHLPTYLSIQDHYPKMDTIESELLENLKLIYEQLRLLNPDMEIFVVPLYNPYYTYLKNNEVLINQFHAAKDSYVTLSKNQNHVVIIPELSNMLEDTKYSNVASSDRAMDPHPNALGHAKIADAFIEQAKTKPVVKEKNRMDQVIPYLYIGISIVVVLIAVIWYRNRN